MPGDTGRAGVTPPTTAPITGLDAQIQKQLDMALAEQSTLMQQAAELDPDGTPSAASFVAQKKLDSVNTFIRNMITTLQAQGKISDAQAAAQQKAIEDQKKADALKAEQDRKDKIASDAQDKRDADVRDALAETKRKNLADEERQGRLDTQSVSDTADARGIAQQNANTSSGNLSLDQVKQQAAALQQDYQNLVDAGKLTNDQAVQQFTAQFQMLTAGMSAGQDAVKNAQLATVNQVGPGWGASFAQGLQGVGAGDPSKVNYSPSDFTYPTPDYNGIAARATAAAIAHLSPFAAQLYAHHQATDPVVVAAKAPAYQPGGTAPVTVPAAAPYRPPAVAQPSVVQAAAQSVVGPATPSQQPYTGPPYMPGRPQ